MTTNIKTQSLDIRTSDGVCDAYIAHPAEAKPHPGVLMLMDAFGLRPYMYETADTLAAHGYFVLLPNLFYRVKRSPVIEADFPLKPEDMEKAHGQIMPLARGYDHEAGQRDVGVFLDFLAQQSQVQKGKFGATGYCLGGGVALRAAANYPDKIGAAASFHAGNLASDQPNSPHKLLPKVKARLYFGHADNDKSMPAEQIERLRNALDEAHVRYEMEVYTDAAHGYTMKDLPAYNARALEKHWKKLFELLEQTIKI